jgi:hypothetical protein
MSAWPRLEAICDAIAQYNNYWEPESEAYALRNPGLLLGENGKRVFTCHRGGYAALMDKVRRYCETCPDWKVEQLLVVLGIKMHMQQERALDFAARSISLAALKPDTRLAWFIEINHG